MARLVCLALFLLAAVTIVTGEIGTGAAVESNKLVHWSSPLEESSWSSPEAKRAAPSKSKRQDDAPAADAAAAAPASDPSATSGTGTDAAAPPSLLAAAADPAVAAADPAVSAADPAVAVAAVDLAPPSLPLPPPDSNNTYGLLGLENSTDSDPKLTVEDTYTPVPPWRIRQRPPKPSRFGANAGYGMGMYGRGRASPTRPTGLRSSLTGIRPPFGPPIPFDDDPPIVEDPCYIWGNCGLRPNPIMPPGGPITLLGNGADPWQPEVRPYMPEVRPSPWGPPAWPIMPPYGPLLGNGDGADPWPLPEVRPSPWGPPIWPPIKPPRGPISLNGFPEVEDPCLIFGGSMCGGEAGWPRSNEPIVDDPCLIFGNCGDYGGEDDLEDFPFVPPEDDYIDLDY